MTVLPQQSLDDERRLADAVAASSDGMLVIDREGRITHANNAAERMLGITPSTPHGSLNLETSQVMGESDLAAGVVIRLSHADSADLPAGESPDALRAAVGGIANDFSNILSAIVDNISLARTEVNRSDEIYRTLTYVEKASRRARDLAQRLTMLAGVAAAVAADTDLPAEGEPVRGAGRILVVDDEEMARHGAARMLKSLGYDVDLAADGSEALDMYARALAEGKPYRVVLMDLTVREGMGGEQAMAELRRIDPGVRTIVSTGHLADPMTTEFRRHGFQGTVMKPFDIMRLSHAVRRVVEDQT